MANAIELEPLKYEGAFEWVANRPFMVLGGIGVPIVSAILYKNVKSGLAESAGGKLSVVLMHTRVVGQASVLALLVGTMVMSGNGPFATQARHREKIEEVARRNEVNFGLLFFCLNLYYWFF